MIGLDGVVDGLKEVRLGGVLVQAEHVEADKACSGGHSFDPDVARLRVGLGGEVCTL